MNLRLKQVRESLEITQAMTQEATGVSIKRLSSYENGHRQPSLDTLALLADYYCVTMDYLAGRDIDSADLPSFRLKSFGKRVGEFREKRGMTLTQLAERVGISNETLNGIESGDEIPDMECSMRLLNALKLSPNEAFMDMLDEGYRPKANYIGNVVASLPAEVRHYILDTAMFMADIYKSKYNPTIESREKEGR